MTDPDFGRGDGDPLGGPNVANPEPVLPDIDQVKLEFRVHRPGWAVQTVVINFMDPQGEAEEHLMALWRIWHGQEITRLTRDGLPELPFG